MTDDASPENLRKFLESDDPAMRRMGLSMAKGSGVPEELLGLVAGLYMWDDDKSVRGAAKSVFMKHAPKDAKQAMKKTWNTSYRTVKTEEALKPKVEAMFQRFKDTPLDTVDVWKPALVRTSGAKVSIVGIMDGFGAEAVQPLIKALGEPNAYVGRAAEWALGKIGKPAVEPLIKALGDEEEIVRFFAADALGQIGDARAVEPLIKALGDENAEVRENAMMSLGQIGDARAVEPLIELLGDEFWVVQPVLLALQMLGDARAVEPFIDALSLECEREDEWNCNHGFSDENKFIQDDIVRAIVQLGDKNAIEPLLQSIIDCYENDSFDGNLEYIEYADENTSHYSTTRGHSVPLEREYVVYALNGLGWKPRTDEERIAYCAAMFQRSEFTDALLEWGAEAIDPLIGILESGETFASKALAELTKELVKTDKEKENIIKFLESKDPAIVMMGASMLKGILE